MANQNPNAEDIEVSSFNRYFVDNCREALKKATLLSAPVNPGVVASSQFNLDEVLEIHPISDEAKQRCEYLLNGDSIQAAGFMNSVNDRPQQNSGKVAIILQGDLYSARELVWEELIIRICETICMARMDGTLNSEWAQYVRQMYDISFRLFPANFNNLLPDAEVKQRLQEVASVFLKQ